MVETGFNSYEMEGVMILNAQQEFKQPPAQIPPGMKPVPLQTRKTPETQAKKVETTTVRFLAQYGDRSGNKRIGLFEIPNIEKDRARDPSGMAKVVSEYVSDPKKLANAIEAKKVNFVSFSEEIRKDLPYAEYKERTKGKTKLDTAFTSSNRDYYLAGSAKPADQATLLAYLNQGNQTEYKGVVTKLKQ